ncbi:MAG TPA: ligase-associated DNA damage response endonuclease PdeM [Acidobacteriota bacterium]|nr:ligase-associated DNA damage response endonuclease PdeM [Acidobacteriota bacterium]
MHEFEAGPNRLLTLCGQHVYLLSQRAVYWPARKTLIVADLLWEKDEAFRLQGLGLPRGVLDDDLARLQGLCRQIVPQRLLVLGDLVHSRQGITEQVSRRIARWRRDLKPRLVLVPANHDRHLRRLPESWGIELAPEFLEEPPFAFAHAPRASQEFLWCGHVHPVVRLRSGLESLRLPCFRIDPACGLLPAFSRFTGGAVQRPRPRRRLFALAHGAVVAL